MGRLKIQFPSMRTGIVFPTDNTLKKVHSGTLTWNQDRDLGLRATENRTRDLFLWKKEKCLSLLDRTRARGNWNNPRKNKRFKHWNKSPAVPGDQGCGGQVRHARR